MNVREEQKAQRPDRLIIITGPTAVGKSGTAVELAKLLDTEVISADSMQIYRGMDIGTAKVTEEEMQGIRHSMIDICDPSENWDVTRFTGLASKEITRVQLQGKIPILCGGTGFYIQALMYGMEFPEEEEDPGLRREYHEKAQREGNHAVWEELRAADPEYAACVPEENLVKCIRALEFQKRHGIRFSEHNRQQEQLRARPVYDTKLFVLNTDREKLFERIGRRVDRMMQEGLLEETGRLLETGISRECTAMQAIGYRQLAQYLDGEIRLADAVEKIKTLSRRYAKKQIVWYKREPRAIWIRTDETDPMEEIRKNLWGDLTVSEKRQGEQRKGL